MTAVSVKTLVVFNRFIFSSPALTLSHVRVDLVFTEGVETGKYVLNKLSELRTMQGISMNVFFSVTEAQPTKPGRPTAVHKACNAAA